MHRVSFEEVTGGAPMEAAGREYRVRTPKVEPRMAFLCDARKNCGSRIW
jgi:hypothetical protein